MAAPWILRAPRIIGSFPLAKIAQGRLLEGGSDFRLLTLSVRSAGGRIERPGRSTVHMAPAIRSKMTKRYIL